MKKLTTIITILYVMIGMGCSKEETPQDNNAASSEVFLKVKANGILWEATQDISCFISNTSTSVTGQKNDIDHFVQIDMAEVDAEGVYDIVALGGTLTYKNGAGVNFYASTFYGGSGTITIEEISGSGMLQQIKGTFSGTVVNPLTSEEIILTEGEFSDN